MQMLFLAQMLSWGIHLYMWVIILYVAVSWLIAFRVLDTRNPQARNLVALLNKVTDPVMRPVQKYVPPIAGIDLTPIIVLVGLQILDSLVWQVFGPRLY